jgi:prepilin-type N-terminal cleavage/methylation domain-containing protein
VTLLRRCEGDEVGESRRRGQYGLTLIELLVVVVILGVLSAVITFSVGAMTAKSLASSCQSDGATLSSAVAAFRVENPDSTVTTSALIGTSDGGPYISSMPHNGDSYAFSIGSSGGIDISINGSAPSPYVLRGPSASCQALTTSNGGATTTTTTTVVSSGQVSFVYTGSTQTFVVPTGVTSATVLVVGASGGQGGASSGPGGLGGAGGSVSGSITVSPGETLTVIVGGAGSNASGSVAGGYGGPYASGGAGNLGPYGMGGGGGGGASGVWDGATPLAIAGGGGGGGYGGGNGGIGGGVDGGNGTAGLGATGATPGGGPIPAANGNGANGGGGVFYGGAGGGGGYGGGGAAASTYSSGQSGGGGSSLVPPGGTTTAGGNTGAGSVTISY